MEIVPEFNTTCYLTIDDRVRQAETAFPLRRTGEAEEILREFVGNVVGGGTIVVRTYEYELYDLRGELVGRAWGWKKLDY